MACFESLAARQAGIVGWRCRFAWMPAHVEKAASTVKRLLVRGHPVAEGRFMSGKRCPAKGPALPATLEDGGEREGGGWGKSLPLLAGGGVFTIARFLQVVKRAPNFFPARPQPRPTSPHRPTPSCRPNLPHYPLPSTTHTPPPEGHPRLLRPPGHHAARLGTDALHSDPHPDAATPSVLSTPPRSRPALLPAARLLPPLPRQAPAGVPVLLARPT